MVKIGGGHSCISKIQSNQHFYMHSPKPMSGIIASKGNLSRTALGILMTATVLTIYGCKLVFM
jgi:hypothetical protein